MHIEMTRPMDLKKGDVVAQAEDLFPPRPAYSVLSDPQYLIAKNEVIVTVRWTDGGYSLRAWDYPDNPTVPVIRNYHDED